MKTKLVFLLLALFTFGCKEDTSLLVEEVGEETSYNLFAIKPEKAKEEALKFVYGNKPLSRNSESITSDIQTVWRTLTISVSGASSVGTRSQSDYTESVPVYIISLENEGEDAGFIVTVGDKRVINRVLAFSDEGEWNISAVGDFEDIFWSQADSYIASSIVENDENDPCDNYMYDEQTEYVKYVSSFRIQWGQSPSPYNDSVPACDATTNKLAGCVAVAMGQIMSYHGRPLSGSYTHPRYNRTVTAQYNWTAMKASTNAQNLTTTAGRSGVANILAEAGTKVYMDYGCNGSGAYPSDVPQAFSQMGYTSSSTASFNLNTVITNINNNRPVFIWGYLGINGHAWVVEGYKKVEGIEVAGKDCPDGMEDVPPTPTGNTSTYNYLYFNLGWHGQSNGFYYADLFSTWHYPQNAGIIYNIQPN